MTDNEDEVQEAKQKYAQMMEEARRLLSTFEPAVVTEAVIHGAAQALFRADGSVAVLVEMVAHISAANSEKRMATALETIADELTKIRSRYIGN